MESLSNKVILISGATSGIGRAAAKLFAERGAAVVLGSRRKERGEELVEEIRRGRGRAVFRVTDVTKHADNEALVDLASTTFGKLDVAFNNAGVEAIGSLLDLDETEPETVAMVAGSSDSTSSTTSSMSSPAATARLRGSSSSPWRRPRIVTAPGGTSNSTKPPSASTTESGAGMGPSAITSVPAGSWPSTRPVIVTPLRRLGTRLTVVTEDSTIPSSSRPSESKGSAGRSGPGNAR